MHFYIYLPIILSLLTSFNYIKNTVTGQTKPNRISWLIWTLAPLSSVAIQLKAGASLEVIPVVMAGIGPLLILIASFFNKKSYWKLNILDYTYGAFSVMSLAMYILWNTTEISILLLILSGFLAGVPTMIKMWTHRESETIYPFMAGFINSVFGLIYSINAYAHLFANTSTATEKLSLLIIFASFSIYLILQNLAFILIYYRNKLSKNG